MGFQKITKQEYYHTIKGLTNPFNLIICLYNTDMERCGVDINSHKERMNYVENFIKNNEDKINEMLLHSPQFNDIEEKSKDFLLISDGHLPWYEEKKGKFYRAVKSDNMVKMVLLHDYGDAISIKASLIWGGLFMERFISFIEKWALRNVINNKG